MERVPLYVFTAKRVRERSGIHLRNAAVDGHQEYQRQHDDACPEDDGGGNERHAWMPAQGGCFSDVEQEIESVPEWHHAAEFPSQVARGMCLRGVVEFYENRIHKGRHSEFRADHEPNTHCGHDAKNEIHTYLLNIRRTRRVY